MACTTIIRGEECGKPTHKVEETSGGWRMEYCAQHWGFVLAGAPVEAWATKVEAPDVQDPAPAEHASVCMGCEVPLETEPADELLGLCHRCSEAYGQAEDWQVDTGAGRW